jgi:hypothetical protein
MCGPSSSEESIANSTQNFGTLLTQNYGQLFATQQATLQQITNSLNPTIAAGPSQRGFSGAEKSALDTTAINNAGAANTAAQQAARTYGAGQGGGGTSGITSGITKQIQGAIASQSAGQEGAALNNIEQADWQQGNANYTRALGAAETAANIENPNATANSATASNQAAFGQQSQITTENNAMGQDIAGFLTAAAGSAGGVAKAFTQPS